MLLALIGDRWVTATDDRGGRRLDDPHDFVRLEIEAALARNVRVIPVLVDGARMPLADELPDSMTALVRRQALELSPGSFESDTNRLVKVLATTFADVRAAQQQAGQHSEHDHAAEAESIDEPGVAAVDLPSSGPAGREGGSPRWGPIIAIAAVAVAVIAVIAMVVVLAGDDGGDDTSARSGGGFDVDTEPVTSRDGVQLTGLEVSATNEPPSVGDTVTVRYSLTNTNDEPLEFAVTFVGARDDADINWDSEDMNEDADLAPGDTLDAQGRILIRSAGAWEVWPCYELAGGQQCPDKWQVTAFLAD